MKLLIINGPNLNLTGKRETIIYGEKDFETFIRELKKTYAEVHIDYRQSNIEGEIIDYLHAADKQYKGIIINPGGYSHTSVSIADAIAAIESPVVEVHMTNIHAREEFRQTSLTARNSAGVITGFGMDSYLLGIEYFLNKNKK